ncbi:MAG TPA: hypothetical protein VM536_18950 [Chloroflexia bacterium]|nr:hypothetical protein [Chloroflexia bacterium]
MSTRQDSSDPSLINGLLLGLLAGAGLVLVGSPLVRDRVNQVAEDFGLRTTPTASQLATADHARDEILHRVAPPPDPLGSGSPLTEQ